MISELLSKLREAKNNFVGWWKKRLQLLRRMANGMRSQVSAWVAIKRAEIRIRCKTVYARIKGRLRFKNGNG